MCWRVCAADERTTFSPSRHLSTSSINLSEFDFFASGLTVLIHLDIVGVAQADMHQTAYPRVLKP